MEERLLEGAQVLLDHRGGEEEEEEMLRTLRAHLTSSATTTAAPTALSSARFSETLRQLLQAIDALVEVADRTSASGIRGEYSRAWNAFQEAQGLQLRREAHQVALDECMEHVGLALAYAHRMLATDMGRLCLDDFVGLEWRDVFRSLGLHDPEIKAKDPELKKKKKTTTTTAAVAEAEAEAEAEMEMDGGAREEARISLLFARMQKIDELYLQLAAAGPRTRAHAHLLAEAHLESYAAQLARMRDSTLAGPVTVGLACLEQQCRRSAPAAAPIQQLTDSLMTPELLSRWSALCGARAAELRPQLPICFLGACTCDVPADKRRAAARIFHPDPVLVVAPLRATAADPWFLLVVSSASSAHVYGPAGGGGGDMTFVTDFLKTYLGVKIETETETETETAEPFLRPVASTRALLRHMHAIAEMQEPPCADDDDDESIADATLLAWLARGRLGAYTNKHTHAPAV